MDYIKMLSFLLFCITIALFIVFGIPKLLGIL